MINVILRINVAVFVAGFLLTACQEEERIAPAAESEKTSSPFATGGTVADRPVLAQWLAQALQAADVQVFFQQEAAKQFDKDTDVLLALVKDQPFGESNQTLVERLGDISGNIQQLNVLLDADPLATVFVPKIAANRSWQEKAPVVALLNESRADGKIAVYDQRGQADDWSATEEPQQAVVVLKTCERVVVLDSKNARSAEDIGRPLGITANGLQLQLSHEAFNPDLPNNVRTAGYASDGKVIDAHNKRSANGTHYLARDYIYYDIYPPEGRNEGVFKNNFTEAITGVQLNTDQAFEKVGGWSEGDPEFHLIVFYRNPDGSTGSVRKVVTINTNNLVQQVTGPWHFKYYKSIYKPSYPISIMPFDVQHGNTWVIKVFEHDPGQASHSIEQTFSFNTTAYPNFENFEVAPFTFIYASRKIGSSVGGRQTQWSNLTANYSTTDTSDDLGIAYHNYESDVLRTYVTKYASETGMLYAPLGSIMPVTMSNYVSSGSLNIYLEPVRQY